VYAFSASIGSVFVNQIITRFRASRVMSFLLTITALLIATIVILEASTGGTLKEPGNHSHHLGYYLHLFPLSFISLVVSVVLFF
jgi:hypothetical protein